LQYIISAIMAVSEVNLLSYSYTTAYCGVHERSHECY